MSRPAVYAGRELDSFQHRHRLPNRSKSPFAHHNRFQRRPQPLLHQQPRRPKSRLLLLNKLKSPPPIPASGRWPKPLPLQPLNSSPVAGKQSAEKCVKNDCQSARCVPNSMAPAAFNAGALLLPKPGCPTKSAPPQSGPHDSWEVDETIARPGGVADVILKVDDVEVARATVKRTVPGASTPSKTLDLASHQPLVAKRSPEKIRPEAVADEEPAAREPEGLVGSF